MENSDYSPHVYVKPTKSKNIGIHCYTTYTYGYMYTSYYDYNENKRKTQKLSLFATVRYICYN